MPITRTQFQQLVRDYQPLPFEAYHPGDPRFRVPMHHVLKNDDRLWMAIRTASGYMPPAPATMMDLGTYPGSLLRLLRRWLPSRADRLIGVGLMISDEFRKAMAEDCGAEILTVNLDPANEQLRVKGYSTRIPLEDGSVQFAFALEVIEHLTSPSHLFAEVFRVLAPGGHLLVTTPNVARIGNIMKLLAGRSTFDRLTPLDYAHPEDEWRPHFREYTLEELHGLYQRNGFQVVEARHFVDDDTRYNIKTIAQRCIDVAKIPFYMVPHFQGSVLVVGRRPVGE